MSRLFAVVVCLLAGSAWAQPFTVIQKSEERVHGLSHTTWMVQNGADPINRFGVQRIVLDNGFFRHHAPPIIVLPSIGYSAMEYTFGDEPGGADFQHSVGANLAYDGLDVFLYSPREAFLKPGQCDRQADCAAAKDWGRQAHIDDVHFIRGLIAADHPHQKPVIGGVSMGGQNGLAAIDQDPDGFAGLWLGDSLMVVPDQSQKAGYDAMCQAYTGALAAGQFVESDFAALFRALIVLQQIAPDAPSPIPLFPPGTTNRQAYVGFITAPSVGPPASIFPTGLIIAAGNPLENRFFYSSEARLNSVVAAFNTYIPIATYRDVLCDFAGDDGFSRNLKKYRGPILSIENGAGAGAASRATIALTSSRDVDIVSYPGFGHFDVIGSAWHKPLQEDRVALWVYTRVLGAR